MTLGVILGLWLVEGSASAFEVAYTDDGEPIRWHERTVELSTPSNGPTAAPDLAALGSLELAAGVWNEALPEGVAIDVRAEDGIQLDSYDGANAVVWLGDEFSDDFDSVALAATVRAYLVPSGEVIDADIAVNANAYSFSTGAMTDCSDAYDMQAVFMHEIGHVLGLKHTLEEPETVMFPSIQRCEEKRTLHEDDRLGVEFLYIDMAADPAEASGCSVASTASSETPWLVGLVLLALTWRRRRRECVAVAAVVVALCSLNTAAQATTVRRVDMSELASRAALVVRGHVVDQKVVTVGRAVYTESTVVVSECWRGACDERITVRQLGGVVGDVVVEVEGVQTLPTAGEVVVFLRHRRDGTAATVGLAQGVFRVAMDQSGGDHLVRDLRGLNTIDSSGELESGTIERWNTDAVRVQVKDRK